MPRLRLPPLPPAVEWGNTVWMKSPRGEGAGSRESGKRVTLANKGLANDFVRELGIRKNEVVIDAYCGPGQTTRALLAGGNDETTSADWKRTVEEQKEKGLPVGPVASEIKRRRGTAMDFNFPPWDVSETDDIVRPVVKSKGRPPKAKANEDGEVAAPPAKPASVTTPKFVVANDPKVSALWRGFGFNPDLLPPSRWEMDDVPEPGAEPPTGLRHLKRTVYPSHLQENLGISPVTIYHWPTAASILSDPLVAQHLEVYDESKGPLEGTKRPWDAPAPPITLVATIPDAVFGDQLVNQWILSATSSNAEGKRGWIWEWGRVRLALLVTRSIYDVSISIPY